MLPAGKSLARFSSASYLPFPKLSLSFGGDAFQHMQSVDQPAAEQGGPALCKSRRRLVQVKAIVVATATAAPAR